MVITIILHKYLISKVWCKIETPYPFPFSTLVSKLCYEMYQAKESKWI